MRYHHSEDGAANYVSKFYNGPPETLTPKEVFTAKKQLGHK